MMQKRLMLFLGILVDKEVSHVFRVSCARDNPRTTPCAEAY